MLVRFGRIPHSTVAASFVLNCPKSPLKRALFKNTRSLPSHRTLLSRDQSALAAVQSNNKISRQDSMAALKALDAFIASVSTGGDGFVEMLEDDVPELEIYDASYFPRVPPGHTEFSWMSRVNGELFTINDHAKTEIGVEMLPSKKTKKQLTVPKDVIDSKKKAGKKKADGGGNTQRRDLLTAMESDAQFKWTEERVFEVEPKPGQPKYLVTFPYPYMNGYLHLGHAFTITKAEFMAGYQRLRGKNVLFPFGFHCTGMPIPACAQRLREEMEQFGNPPKFPVHTEESKTDDAGGKSSKKKGKVASKKSAKKYQWEIMQEFGLSDQEIAKFADPKVWLEYFPSYGMKHLQRFGVKVDWRRSFITTDVNPFYNSFIEWQFNLLRKFGRIKFGNRPCVYSPKEQQPCADHDRSAGEGHNPQQYTIIKLELLPGKETPFTKINGDKLAPLFEPSAKIPEGSNTNPVSRKVYMVAATLRPETMYGQTNCFVLPRGKYVAVLVDKGKDKGSDPNVEEVFICSEHAAQNMNYQGYFNGGEFGQKIPVLAEFEGWDLLGRALKAPYASYDEIFMLPLTTISMGKGTGIVTSVPSDAPADYAALMDAKKDSKFQQKYYLSPEMIEPFNVIPIIHIPKFNSNQSAVDLCTQRKVKSQRDVEKLDAIKDEVYKAGFAQGKMLVGKYQGMSVKDAKEKVQKDLCDAGMADLYWEPEGKVVSRTGVECVVAFTDQYYITYGEPEWKSVVSKHIEQELETFNPIAKDMFRYTVSWLHEWACSREFGLGTRLPFDKDWMIESLSDSTIYMAFYTVCHKLLNRSLDGHRGTRIKVEDLSDSFWEAIFRNGPMENVSYNLDGSIKSKSAMPDEMIQMAKELKAEFEYWYPMDLRVSGKDLINNHLTMSLYNHCAIWDYNQYGTSMMPRAFFTNGHVQLDGRKMAKSEGHFLTLDYAIEQYGADAVRFGCADAGDNLDDANFSRDVANSAILRLTTLSNWMDEMKENSEFLRDGSDTNKWTEMDWLFNNAMNEAIINTEAAYESMKFRDALTHGYMILEKNKNYYVTHAALGDGDGRPNRTLINRYIELQLLLLSPICTHFCEMMWSRMGFEGLIVDSTKEKWPALFQADQIDPILSHKFDFLQETSHQFRQAYNHSEKQRKKKAMKQASSKVKTSLDVLKLEEELEFPANCATVCISDTYKDWQIQALEFLRRYYESNDISDGQWRRVMMKEDWVAKGGKKLKQEVLAFASYIVNEMVPLRKEHAFDLRLPFDEFEFAQRNQHVLFHELELSQVHFVRESDASVSEFLRERTQPGKPMVQFYYQSENTLTQ